MTTNTPTPAPTAMGTPFDPLPDGQDDDWGEPVFVAIVEGLAVPEAAK